MRPAEKEAAEPALERVAPGSIDERDLDSGAAGVELAKHGFEADAVAAHVGFGPDLRIDRQQIALPRRLDAESAEEHQCHGPRLDLAVQLVEGAAHAVAGQVLIDLDGKAIALELVGDVARVVQRFLQRGVGVRIFGIAYDQRKAIAGRKRRSGRNERHEQG
ncbi:hypothetical protein ACVW0I_008452 [Bradyrhizobium sp. LM6.11]